MYIIYLGKKMFFYKHKQLFLLPFCCVALVVLIRNRVRVRIRVRVRVRVKITAGSGGCGLVWFGTRPSLFYGTERITAKVPGEYSQVEFDAVTFTNLFFKVQVNLISGGNSD